MEGKNSAYTKLFNRRRLLSLLRQSPLSRAELARRLGLTRAAISLITEELIAEGVIRESATLTAPGPGRTPTPLEICCGAYYALGISLRRSGCRVGIQDLTGRLLAARDAEGETPEAMVACAKALLEQTKIPREKLLGVGVAAPGPLDAGGGVILNPPDFPRWENFPLGQLLEQELALPVYLENDASAAAVYNYIEQDFPEKENFLLVFVDCGVGSGVISGGRLLRSPDGFTCELGHTSIDFRGQRCSCGNYGCLERYAALDRLVEQFPGYDSWDALMASPRAEEALALEAVYLGTAIVSFANLVRIDAVLLGGRLRKESDRLLPMLEKCVADRPLRANPLRFLPALHDADANVKSACAVVFCRFLEAE